MAFGSPTTFQGGGTMIDAVLGSLGIIPTRDGRILFVDSVNGRGANSGNGPDEALATVVQALTKCVASRYDVIVCMPGHTEALIAAGTITMNKIGVALIGLGHGRARPVFTYMTAAAASFNISAAKCRVVNCVFSAIGVDAVTAMMNISAADVAIQGCEFEHADATNQAVLGILTTAAANRLLIERCQFHGTANAGTAAAIRIVSGDDIIIRDNFCMGDYTTTLGMIDNTTVSRNMLVERNYVFNRTASAAVAMTFAAASDGMIVNNRLQVLTGTAPIVGANMSWVGGNYYAAADATAGTLI